MYLVVYDISNEKRLRRIARITEKFGIRVQKSVFECIISESEVNKLIKEVLDVMKLDEDNLRVYEISSSNVKKIRVFGNSIPPIEEDDIIIV